MMASSFHMAFMPNWWMLGAALLGAVFGYFFCNADS